MENILLQVWICREVDGREGNIAKQTSTGTPVESKDAQLSDDVHRALWHSTFYFGRLTLDLQADFSEGMGFVTIISRVAWDIHNL